MRMLYWIHIDAGGIAMLGSITKGFDAEFKVTFALILRRLVAKGVTILMVSHDVRFCVPSVWPEDPHALCCHSSSRCWRWSSSRV